MTETTRQPVYASKAKPWLKYYEEKYIHQTVPECSAFELVCRNNERHLGDTALEYYGRKFSYADLIVQVKKTAAALQALGVKKGDIITVVSVMTPEVVYAFYAADLLGATLNLVDPRYSAEGIREYIEEVESRLLICLNVVYPRCHQAAKRTSVERVVVLSPADSLPLAKAVGYKLTNPDKNHYASNVLRWKDFIAAGKGHSPAAVPYDPQHTCVVVHTQGRYADRLLLQCPCAGVCRPEPSVPPRTEDAERDAALHRLRLQLRHPHAAGHGAAYHHHPQSGPG